MHIAYESMRDNVDQRLQQIAQRYYLSLEQLANATESYETLCEMPGVSERQLRQALQHITRAQRRVCSLRSELEQLGDFDSMA
jgi:hypothetical protein